uniref:Nucleoside-diphosphate kinase n=1 Tax=Leptobrachium leishanense TaxID=445787 RepID=A0A8C5MSQ1_9ANUR
MAEETAEKPRAKRIFINNIDSYVARNIGKYLSGCVVAGEEEEADNTSDASWNQPKQGLFQVVGSLSNPDAKKLKYPVETYTVSSRDDLLRHLLECDVIIYNITEDASQIDEASWASSALHTELEQFQHPKMFILIFSIMTWARSKSLDPDDPELPFTEDDYRRRKCHLDFKDHLSVEKLVIKLGKSNKGLFSTYVVCSAVPCSAEEGILHSFFKEAWLGETPARPLFGNGLNCIPLIHITDLASVVQNIADHRPRTHFLVAVDDSLHTLEEITKCISEHLGPGKIQKVPKEAAFLRKDITQLEIDHLLVNLRMEAVFLKESFNISWVSQTGLVENIEICVLGPQAVGKTTVCEMLCKHYKLHHIKIKDVITDAIAKLEALVKTPEDEEEEGEESSENWQEILDGVKENMEQNGGRLDDSYVIKFIRDKLKSMPCQNQGYVLDGYPKTYEQAKELFNLEDGGEEEQTRGKTHLFDETITPDYVISLDAPDDFLKNWVINLPESVIQGTHYTHDQFLQALHTFRDLNTEDETILNYFDEAEINPQHIDVSRDDDPRYRNAFKQIIKEVGEPKNYGLTPEEVVELELRAAHESVSREAERTAELERREAEEAAEKRARWEEWNKRHEKLKRQEEEVLEAQSVPLRNYLMRNVMPTLVQGLNECCKIRPDDPVDYLAEFLFKNNPEFD